MVSTDNPAVVTAVVVSYNSADVLPACISALAATGARIVVVDNASTDQSVAVAREHGAEVIANAANQGYGRAINLAAQHITTPLILIVNPDAIVTKPALDRLLEAARCYPDAVLLGPALVTPSGTVDFRPSSHVVKNSHKWPWRGSPPQGDCSVVFIMGTVMLVRTAAFRAIGGFDDEIFLYFEDTDFCQRLALNGGRFVYVAEAQVLHGGGKSSAPSTDGIHKRRWHFAWSKAYVCHKFGLPSNALAGFLHGAINIPIPWLLRDRAKFESHFGFAQGSLAYLLGRRAIDYERLGPLETLSDQEPASIRR